MGFKYYCTNCGHELSQDNMLFDMQYSLTQSLKAFKVLRFRLPLSTLRALCPEFERDSSNFICCPLSMEKVAEIISNEYNLNDPAIKSLTLEQIKAYLKNASKLEESNEEPDADFNAMESPKEDDTTAKKESPYQEPPAILALLNKNTASKSNDDLKKPLCDDLNLLMESYKNDSFYLDFKIQKEGGVINGYAIGNDLSQTSIIDQARVCCRCSYPVFRYAGTADHNIITFFGTQKSGKTSLMVSLIHYAKDAITGNVKNDAWKGCLILPVDEMTLLNGSTPSNGNEAQLTDQFEMLLHRNQKLEADLENFEKGAAPEKTPNGQKEDVYSATFLLQSKDKRYHLLTLTDVPGEVAELAGGGGGSLDYDNIRNDFPPVLKSKAFVFCFDATNRDINASGSEKSSQEEDSAVRARLQQNITVAKELQKKMPRPIPMLIAFTKDPQLEDNSASDNGSMQ